MKKLDVNLSIYTFDIDFAGHVGNSVYIQWVEMGRCKFMEAVGFPIQAAIASGFVPVMVHMNIFYKQPLYLGEQVRLEIWLSELKKVTHTVEFRFYNREGILAATGHQKGVFIDPKTQRPHPITSAIRDLFLPYLYVAESPSEVHEIVTTFSS